MAQDRLITEQRRDGSYQVVWMLGEEQETGAVLGDHDHVAELKADPKNEHAIATKAAADCQPDGKHGMNGFYWDSKSKADAARRAANAAIKAAQSSVPWPDWAIKASAAGWKAPKGWRP